MSQTVVYIDAANIILSAKNCNIELDILKVVRHLQDSFRTERIIYFSGNFASMRNLFLELENSGIEMVYKEIYNENNKSKANCDVEISHRITCDMLLSQVEKIVVLSGDGDFVHLYDFANARDIAVKVIAFDPASCSRMVKKRQFTKVSYLIELGPKITKEKPPAST